MANIYSRGVAHFKIDGQAYTNDCEGGFDIKIMNSKKETIVGSDGLVYYSEKPQVSTISGKVIVKPGTDLNKLINATNVTVTVQTNDGSVYGVRNAVYTGDASLSTSDGTFSFEYQGVGYFG